MRRCDRSSLGTSGRCRAPPRSTFEGPGHGPQVFLAGVGAGAVVQTWARIHVCGCGCVLATASCASAGKVPGCCISGRRVPPAALASRRPSTACWCMCVALASICRRVEQAGWINCCVGFQSLASVAAHRGHDHEKVSRSAVVRAAVFVPRQCCKRLACEPNNTATFCPRLGDNFATEAKHFDALFPFLFFRPSFSSSTQVSPT